MKSESDKQVARQVSDKATRQAIITYSRTRPWLIVHCPIQTTNYRAFRPSYSALIVYHAVQTTSFPLDRRGQAQVEHISRSCMLDCRSRIAEERSGHNPTCHLHIWPPLPSLPPPRLAFTIMSTKYRKYYIKSVGCTPTSHALIPR